MSKKTVPKNSKYKIHKKYVSITPQMICGAIKKLQMRRAYVTTTLIAEYLRQRYPLQNNSIAFKAELNEKLKYAVCVGLITKHGEDKYCMPTLRQEANTVKTAFTAFWELCYASNTLSTKRKRNFIAKGNMSSDKYQNRIENNRNVNTEDIHIVTQVNHLKYSQK